MTKLDQASDAARAPKRLQVTTLMAGAALLLLATVPSQAAITPNNVDPWQHIVDCAGALVSNPSEHAQFCSPGHADALTFHTSFVWTAVNPPVIPPPTPPVEMCDGSPCEVVLDFVGD